METTCAVCRLSDGLVMNVIVAKPSDPAPDGCRIVEIMTGEPCSIGWHYADGGFHGPFRYALCVEKTGEVVAFFVASHGSPKPTPPDGCFSVLVNGDSCDIGWTWDGSAFSPPVA